MSARDQAQKVLDDCRESMKQNVSKQNYGTVTIYLAAAFAKASERYQGRPMREVKR